MIEIRMMRINNMEAWKLELYGYNDELCHYGIKGQKWGERHWQNPDGTFNEAGKERYFENGTGENYKSVKPTNSERLAKGITTAKTVASKAQSVSGKVMEKTVKGREIFANKEKRIERGERLKSQHRTIVGAVGRKIARNALVNIGGLYVGAVLKGTGHDLGAAACMKALTVYDAMSAIRLVQDVRDIHAYNESKKG